MTRIFKKIIYIIYSLCLLGICKVVIMLSSSIHVGFGEGSIKEVKKSLVVGTDKDQKKKKKRESLSELWQLLITLGFATSY